MKVKILEFPDIHSLEYEINSFITNIEVVSININCISEDMAPTQFTGYKIPQYVRHYIAVIAYNEH